MTPALLAECRDRLAQGRAPATVNGYLAALSHAFTVAVVEWEWLESSPTRRVRRPREPDRRVRFLSEEERRRLMAACQASSNRFLTPVVVLALSTGARKQEILGLTWADVDPGRARISFATPELLWKVLTAKRWEVLKAMAGQGALTIREVARRVGRDVKAVHGDVHALIDAGLLTRTEANRVAFPFDAIRVEFTLRAA